MKTENYHSNVVRFLDKKGNKSLIQLKDEYDNNGILQKITFDFQGIGSNSEFSQTNIFDFKKLTAQIGKETYNMTSKEELKEYLLYYFNKSNKIKLICPKENCTNPNCKSHITIGNKIEKSEKTKRPYFSSDCNGLNYGETPLHLNAKIDIYKYLMEKKSYYIKTNSSTTIENIEIEKSFSYGNGQERRADVYYEKHYTNSNGELVIEKFAIEVQRSNILYPELTERTNWYKENNISTFWIVLDEIFHNDKDTIKTLSESHLDLPLLSLISFSMKHYNNRFFIYDSDKRKILALTIQQENIEQFNDLEDIDKRNMKKLYTTKNLYIISKEKEGDYYKLLPYVDNRSKPNIYSEISSVSTFKESKDVMHCYYNEKKKMYEFVKFLNLKLGNLVQNKKTLTKTIKQKNKF